MKNKITILFFFFYSFIFSQETICNGDSGKASIKISLISNGLYNVSYSLSAPNNLVSAITSVSFVNGIGVLTIPASQLVNVGSTTLTVFSISNIASLCSSTLLTPLTKIFIIDPYLDLNINSDYSFCKEKQKKVMDISNNTRWYNYEKQPIDLNDILVSSTYYYKDITSKSCLGPIFNKVNVIIEDCEMRIPTAFTPNGDNWNDTFNILNIADKYPNFEITIMNRFSRIVYKGKNGWKGTLNNKDSEVLENGVYYMYLNYNDPTIENYQHTILIQK